MCCLDSPANALSSSLFSFSRDWPIVHGIPQWLLAHIYIPAKAKALPHEAALALMYPVVSFILHTAAA